MSRSRRETVVATGVEVGSGSRSRSGSGSGSGSGWGEVEVGVEVGVGVAAACAGAMVSGCPALPATASLAIFTTTAPPATATPITPTNAQNLARERGGGAWARAAVVRGTAAGAGCRQASRAARMSSAEGKRAAGAFWSARAITASSAGETSGFRSRAGTGTSERCFVRNPTGVSDANGSTPVVIWYRRTPTE